jgi:cytochrome b pre-mRNA-processing protein 3
MILPAFRRNPHSRSIHALYGMIVAQARSPAFYADYGVPDTVEGRFDLIVLHLVLVLARLGRDHEPRLGPGRHAELARGRSPERALGQGLFDAFCRDLDDNLREMGVGDLAVPREMRRFGEAFYGRQAAYREALAAADDRELEKALARNIFEAAGTDDRAARLARYARAVAKLLDTVGEDALVAGQLVFPNPEVFAHA